jgi:RNA polymerase sigma-70 factor (ECF subfamily)
MDWNVALARMRAGGAELAAGAAERSLVDRARAMEPAAWDDLYSEHHHAIYRYAYFRLGDAAAAEDLAHEVFLEALRGIKRYEYRGVPFRAWLYRIAHHVSADYQRRRSARPVQVELPDGDAPGTPSEGDFADSVLQRQDLLRALEHLTGEQQQVVILRFFEGLSLAEVAAATGRPEGAVKSMQHRALERMRAVLGKGGR